MAAPAAKNMYPATPQTNALTETEPTDVSETIYYYPTSVTVTPGLPSDDPNTVTGPIQPGAPLYPTVGTDVPASPVAPEGLTDDYLTRTVTETIDYRNGLTGEAIPGQTPVTATVTLKRNAHVAYDQLGNAVVTYDAWTPATFAAVTSPTVTDMYTTMPTVAAMTVTGSADLHLVVNYYPTTVTVTPGTVTDPNLPNPVTGPLQPGDPLYPNDTTDTPTAPAGVDTKDLTKVVTETIRYVNGVTGEKVANSVAVQKTMTRNATLTYDQAGNATVTYGKWTPAVFVAVTSPTNVTGMYTTMPVVAEMTDTDPADLVLTVNYYPTVVTVTPEAPSNPATIGPKVPGDPLYPDSTKETPTAPDGIKSTDLTQTVTEVINYVNGVTGKKVADQVTVAKQMTRTATLTYNQTGQATVTYSAWTPAVFDAVPSPTLDNLYTTMPVVAEMTDTDPANLVLTVNYYPTSVTVTPETPSDTNNPATIEPKAPGDPLYPNGTTETPTAPNGVDANHLVQTVTETINYVNGLTGATVAAPKVVQQQMTRTATITYDQAGNGTVTYSKWTPAIFAAVTSPTDITGMYTTMPVVAEMTDTDPANLHLTVNYYPTTVTVTPGTTPDSSDPNPVIGPLQPGVPLYPADSKDTPTAPAGVDANDLTRTVTETINYVNGVTGVTVHENHTAQVTLTRKATITYDQAGKAKVTYGQWSTADFGIIGSPDVTGMYTTMPAVTAMTVTHPIDLHLTVNYYPTTVTVTPGTATDPNNPSEVTGPKAPGDPLYPTNPEDQTTDTPKTPAGVDASDLSQTVTETIHYVDVNEKALHEPATATIQYQRTATIDYSDPAAPTVTYGNWIAQTNEGTFTAVTSPVISTYVTPTLVVATHTVGNQVPAANTDQLADYTTDVTYYQVGLSNGQNDVNLTVHFVDTDGHSIKPDTVQTGTQGTNFAFDAPVISGYLLTNPSLARMTGTYHGSDMVLTLTYEKVLITSPDQGRTTNPGGTTNPTAPTSTTAGADNSATPATANTATTTPLTATAAVTATPAATTPTTKPTAAQSGTQQATLPQTGDQANQHTAWFGAMLLGMSALLGLAPKRSKKH